MDKKKKTKPKPTFLFSPLLPTLPLATDFREADLLAGKSRYVESLGLAQVASASH